MKNGLKFLGNTAGVWLCVMLAAGQRDYLNLLYTSNYLEENTCCMSLCSPKHLQSSRVAVKSAWIYKHFCHLTLVLANFQKTHWWTICTWMKLQTKIFPDAEVIICWKTSNKYWLLNLKLDPEPFLKTLDGMAFTAEHHKHIYTFNMMINLGRAVSK